VIFDLSGSIPLPDIRNGNGSADYLISGFDLSAINPGDRLLFQATWDHAVDGGESFYIVPVVNPRDKETSAGAFGPGFLLSYDRPQNAYGGWDIGGAGPSNVFAHRADLRLITLAFKAITEARSTQSAPPVGSFYRASVGRCT